MGQNEALLSKRSPKLVLLKQCLKVCLLITITDTMVMSGLDIFDQGNRTTTRKLTSLDSRINSAVKEGRWGGIQALCGVSLPEVLRTRDKLVEIKRFVTERLQEAKKVEMNSTLYWPKPYGEEMEDNRRGVVFTVEGHVKPYLNQIQAINNYLEAGLPVDFCINAQIDQSGRNSKNLSEAELKKVKENRDCYLHYTILAYTGFFKALKCQREDKAEKRSEKIEEEIGEINGRLKPLIKEIAFYTRARRKGKSTEQIAPSLKYVRTQIRELEKQRGPLKAELIELEEKVQSYDLAINDARNLAVDVTVQAAKVYNKGRFSSESVEGTLRGPNSSMGIQMLQMIDELSGLFADHFYDPTNQETLMASILRRTKFFQAMKTLQRTDRQGKTKYGMKDVLTELENRTELYKSAAYIPDAFGNVMQIFGALGSNGNGSR